MGNLSELRSSLLSDGAACQAELEPVALNLLSVSPTWAVRGLFPISQKCLFRRIRAGQAPPAATIARTESGSSAVDQSAR